MKGFRKILVVAGYSIDTVEKGKEALGLIMKRDYDFVFTDLKMPEMDGLEVTKAVKHLRPDIDVIGINTYGGGASLAQVRKEAGQAGLRHVARLVAEGAAGPGGFERFSGVSEGNQYGGLSDILA